MRSPLSCPVSQARPCRHSGRDLLCMSLVLLRAMHRQSGLRSRSLRGAGLHSFLHVQFDCYACWSLEDTLAFSEVLIRTGQWHQRICAASEQSWSSCKSQQPDTMLCRHPDKNQPDDRAECEARMKDLNAAYTRLEKYYKENLEDSDSEFDEDEYDPEDDVFNFMDFMCASDLSATCKFGTQACILASLQLYGRRLHAHVRDHLHY